MTPTLHARAAVANAFTTAAATTPPDATVCEWAREILLAAGFVLGRSFRTEESDSGDGATIVLVGDIALASRMVLAIDAIRDVFAYRQVDERTLAVGTAAVAPFVEGAVVLDASPAVRAA